MADKHTDFPYAFRVPDDVLSGNGACWQTLTLGPRATAWEEYEKVQAKEREKSEAEAAAKKAAEEVEAKKKKEEEERQAAASAAAEVRAREEEMPLEQESGGREGGRWRGSEGSQTKEVWERERVSRKRATEIAARLKG